MEDLLDKKITPQMLHQLEEALPYYTLNSIFNIHQLLYLYKNVQRNSKLYEESKKIIENFNLKFDDMEKIFYDSLDDLNSKDDIKTIDILLEKIIKNAASPEEKARSIICSLKKQNKMILKGFSAEQQSVSVFSFINNIDIVIKALMMSLFDLEIQDILLDEIGEFLASKKPGSIDIYSTFSPLETDQIAKFLCQRAINDGLKEQLVQILMQRNLSMDKWDDIINKSAFEDQSIKNRILDILVDPVNKFNNLKKQFLSLTNTPANSERKQQLLSDMLYISNTFEQASFVALYAMGKLYEGAVRKISGFRGVPLDKLIEICSIAVDDQGDMLRKTLIVMMSHTKTPLDKWIEIAKKHSKNHIIRKVSEAMIKKMNK